jgi:hypothetical protein
VTALNGSGIAVSKRTLERRSQRQYLEAYAEAQAEVHREAWQSSLIRAIQVLALASESPGRLEAGRPLGVGDVAGERGDRAI